MVEANILVAMIAVLATLIVGFVSLAALVVTMNRHLRRDLGDRIDGVEKRIDGVEKHISDVEKRIGDVEKRQGELAERMAKLEGLLEGLREAVSGRRAA